jgi:hypothetical protein
MNPRDQVVEALQAHLQTAEVVKTQMGSFRMPVGHITCGDGTKFSIQASQFTYCSPRNDQGPWTHVEVMTLTEGAEPKFWTHDHAGDNLAGYVPLTAVADEIIRRGNLVLTAP